MKAEWIVRKNGSILTAFEYRGEILDPIMRIFAGTISGNFILMQDNAPPTLLECAWITLIVRIMGWPARSPALENVWNILYRRIPQHEHPPMTIQELLITIKHYGKH